MKSNSSQIKKDEDSLSGIHLPTRSKSGEGRLGEKMPEDTDMESVEKHFFVEDDVIVKNSIANIKRKWGRSYRY